MLFYFIFIILLFYYFFILLFYLISIIILLLLFHFIYYYYYLYCFVFIIIIIIIIIITVNQISDIQIGREKNYNITKNETCLNVDPWVSINYVPWNFKGNPITTKEPKRNLHNPTQKFPPTS